MSGDPQWNREEVLKTIKTEQRLLVRLLDPIPVHVLYWTAWVDQDGLLHFRDDIYDRDKPLDIALQERPPRA